MSIVAIKQSVIDSVKRCLTSAENTHIHFDPAIEGVTDGAYENAALPLHRDVDGWLRDSFPDGLYTHQHAAIQAVLEGRNTVVATKTSSGKSLIYSVPVLNSLCEDADATALFLYPQKALANDQLMKLQAAAQQIPCLEHLATGFGIRRYDGGTPQDDRPAIRKKVQVVLTNPDMLHYSLLQYHDQSWGRFFRNLKYIAIDECHEYRGIFGTNVAYILRRLRSICDYHGSNPTMVATSATIHEPREHMEMLTGSDFQCIGGDLDGSRQGARKYWMVSGDEEHYYDYGRKLALRMAEEGLSVLAFCPGRVAAERMMARSSNQGENEFVRVYRAGLMPSEREEIEQGLRDKSVRLVFSTSALKLGIDIGAVDVVMCIGLPSSMMSLWQRAGRAARAGKEGAVVLIPADSPIDSYYARHPQELFDRDNEPLVLNLSNRRVVCEHYACATNEMGGDDDRLNLEILGETCEHVKQLRSEGRLDMDCFYRADPHFDVNIRSMGEGNYKLEYGSNQVGEVDEAHLLREAYRNAIYRHGGIPYRVRDVIRGKRKVILERERSWNETTPFIMKKVRLKRRDAVADHGQLLVAKVAIDVTEFLLNVVEKDRSGNVVNQWQGNGGMPSHPLPTHGTMLRLDKPLWDSIEANLGSREAKSALQSVERLLRSLFPTISGPCDTQDFSSASEVLPDGTAALYLYDLVYDGVDLTTAAFEGMCELIAKAIERLGSCDCDNDAGCFRCIANPRSDEPTSKTGTRSLLDAISDVMDRSPTVTVGSRSPDSDWDAPSTMKCHACDSELKIGSRFCSECGERQDI